MTLQSTFRKVYLRISITIVIDEFSFEFNCIRMISTIIIHCYILISLKLEILMGAKNDWSEFVKPKKSKIY